MNSISSATLCAIPLINNTSQTPMSVRLIKYLSVTGAVASIATIIYGLAANILALMVIGGVFSAMTLSSFYLIHQAANLKAIEEDTRELKKLEASITARDVQVRQLTAQLQEINQKMTAQKNDLCQLLQKDAALQQKYNTRLKESADTLAKAQADAKTALDRTADELSRQIQGLQQQSDKDQKLIVQLNQTVASARDQIAGLQAALADLQKQIADYRQQNSDYAKLNARLTQQIKTLSESLRTPDIDVSAVTAHADKLEKQIALQKTQADKASRTISDISSMLDAINRRLPPQQRS